MYDLNDLENYRLTTASRGALLRVIMEDWKASDEYAHVCYGLNYYKCQNDAILERKKQYIVDGITYDDLLRSNNKIPSGFFKILVDQKKDYIAGNNITFKAEDAEKELIKEIIGRPENVTRSVNTKIKNASRAGYSAWQVYTLQMSGKWMFRYAVVPSQNIILIYDGTLENNLVEVLKWWETEELQNNDLSTVTYVEWWNAKNYEIWKQVNRGEDYVSVEERSHFNIIENQGTQGEQFKGGTWGDVPFIATPNNIDFMTDLQTIKEAIDDYDRSVSDFSNDLEDVLEKVLVLKGYQGANLQEFMNNLKNFRAIKVKGDGGVDSLENTIEADAREKHLDRLEKMIYSFGQGVDVSTENFGQNPSGVALKFLFSLLDLKSNDVISGLKISLNRLLEFGNKYQTLVRGQLVNTDKVEFVFNKGLIINEQEIIQNLAVSQGMLSKETIVSKHPYVNDAEAELEKLENETPEIVLPEEE